ncbi:1-acyl-sn-glycerol-3-phosphate acyltransferase [Trichothermofontia sichuanensis B231]|uniref:1-acyl-sn-glycerol-3-phosphate acyltransferase n=1 Tax=Trichothermofontia sichuanensis TaxID=3045816 RepID=UPI0022473A8F|nr:1-acyl-sn-glycerol-3-phosphate acyltransferase [Trichothermofontia sichuanensis]UZQ53427.1 1-acyl-sn-glycerol-3-phosphate acyltransferase [Trichothermofontia sichuanensis B231]
MPDFYPPRLNPFLVRGCQLISPIVGRGYYRLRLQVEPESLDRLRRLRQERVLLLPNHPTFHDWIAIFLLSARLSVPFYYLAAYERFQGWEGRFLQAVGAYSIRRGLGDRASFAYTVELLMRPCTRLVVFAEGGCSFQNDTVMPFREGAVQMAFQAMSRCAKQTGEIPNLYAIPLSLKYQYRGNMERVLDATLRRLEQQLQVPIAATPYDRLRQVAGKVLAGFEQDYGFDPVASEAMPWNDRIQRLKTEVLHHCEQELGISPPPHSSLRERVYRIQHTLETQANADEAVDLNRYEAIQQATYRLLNFNAIYDGYVAENPTPERFLDTLTRLEREVFKIDQPLPKGDRDVYIKLGKIINLRNYFSQYKAQKSQTISELTEHLRQAVQANLDR